MIEQNLQTLSFIVYDWEEQLVIQTDDYNEALNEYEKCKAAWEDYVRRDGEFSENEKVVLAVVLKDLYSGPTEEQNENGDNYWSFYEDSHSINIVNHVGKIEFPLNVDEELKIDVDLVIPIK